MIPSQKNQVVNREYILHYKEMVTKMAPLKTGVLEVNHPQKEPVFNMLRTLS